MIGQGRGKASDIAARGGAGRHTTCAAPRTVPSSQLTPVPLCKVERLGNQSKAGTSNPNELDQDPTNRCVVGPVSIENVSYYGHLPPLSVERLHLRLRSPNNFSRVEVF